MDFAGDIYIKYYEAQAGGSISVFSGSRRYHPQSGAGLGDILQGIFRTIVPVALNGVGSFVDKINKSHVSDSILKNAAKAALGPLRKPFRLIFQTILLVHSQSREAKVDED